MSANLSQMWATLGIAYHVDIPETPATPEEGIIAFLKSGEFPDDKKMMSIIMSWLEEYTNLVHIERLKNLCDTLSTFEIAVLGGLAKKCTANGDHRWNVIVKEAKNRVGGKPQSIGDSESYIKLRGLDPDFQEFGLRIALIKVDAEKKLIPRKFLIKKNTWIKNRVLFGTNLRADIATIRELHLASTAYRAAQIAFCSMNAAYRNWSDLEEVGWFSETKNLA